MFLAPGSKSKVAKRHFLEALPQKDNLELDSSTDFLHLILNQKKQFTLKARREGKVFECQLKLVDIQYRPMAVVGMFSMEAHIIGCNFDRKQGKDIHLLKTLHINMHLDEVKPKAASVQWISYLEPSICDVLKLDRSALSALNSSAK
jgi:hypothetical protein